jgi:branched-chain amino acid transport system substrate-binding protein
MKKTKLPILLVAVFLVLMFGALSLMNACRAPAPAKGPIKIGAVLPFTGALADAGPKVKQGIDFAFSEAGGEVAGRQIQVMYRDGPEQATDLENTKGLVERDKVDAVIGFLLEFCISYMNDAKVPLIGVRPILPRPGAEGKLVYCFMPDGTFKMFEYPMGWYAYDKLGYRTAVCVGHDMDDGRKSIEYFTESFEAKGGKVVQTQIPPVDTPDYGPYLLSLQKADVTVLWAYPPELLRYLTQYNEFGLFQKQPVIIPLCENLLHELLPALGDCTLGIKGSDDYFYTIDTPANKKFVAGLKEMYGEDISVDAWTLGGYEAASVILAALKATGGDTTPEKFRQAILNVNIETPSTKSLTFRPDGWGSKDMNIFEIQKVDGQYRWMPIYTYSGVDPTEPVAP